MYEKKGNPKKTWKIIIELTSKNRKATQVTEIDLNGDLINFDEHFSNIGPKLADKIGKGNRPYVDYLSDYNIDASFQLKETDS